ncbi:adenylate-forming enzyme AfeA [Aspergillus glaucus CBS 516.65]|uniref:AMP-dependent synthetase/ligase domain-containing protein n=1 Tax=Aspergillus glaucus CBS 516.65 TaxID=1160497 RepID=A0A1L9VBZ8_ASPGL|nr:hypothetical protein ASPGLDRAFT_669867 [Aspergillus glaucus CBS 516.65]OJJ81419.1 hypothetical protein ASPGLDRAFT_669867 [Aspergillus glaucus CBS 516.65]
MGPWESSLALSQSGNSVYTDLLTFAFRGPIAYDDQQPLFIDAEDPSRALSAGQFRLLVRTLIAGLQAHHVQRGDCVLVHLGNSILYPALFYSIIGAGGVYMGSNPRSQPAELEHLLELSEPKLIITSPDALGSVLRASTGRGMLPSQVCLLDTSAPQYVTQLLQSGSLAYPGAIESLLPEQGYHRNFAHLLGYGENDWVTFNDEAIAKSTPAALYSTSGTGGLPKAAILSHHAIVSQHLAIAYDVPYNATRLLSLPFFHLFGSLWAHIFTVRYGQPLFVLPRFELTQFVAAVHQYQITETYMVPAMIHVFNQSALPLSHLLSSLRYVGVAGAPIDAASMQLFQSQLHPYATAGQLWGMTEAGVVFQCRYGDRVDHGSIGPSLPGYEVRLVSADGYIVTEDGQDGELFIRGAGVLTCYKGRDDAKDANGWFRTGDVASIQNGRFYIKGRTKELIKVRGWQVAPAELEAVLLKHPAIEDAAVIGATSKDGSEVPRAFVVLSKDPNINPPAAHDVYTFSRKQLASYKALDGGVIFVEDIPRTASGKIQRFKLAKMNEYRMMMSSLCSDLEAGGVAV